MTEGEKKIKVCRGEIVGLYGIWGDGDATLRLKDGTEEGVRLSCKGPRVIAALGAFFGKVLGEPGEVPTLSPIDNKTGGHVGKEIYFVVNEVDGSLRGFMPVGNKKQISVMPKTWPGDAEDEEISNALERKFDEELENKD